jgi:hypothetical protein
MGRLFSFVGLLTVLAIGMYLYSKELQSTSAPAGGNNPKAAVNITGVRADLVGIAQAERAYFASENKYGSLDELISSHAVTINRQRPPYTYEVETHDGGFRVVATRSTAPGSNDAGAGLPAQISVDENMEFNESQ